MNNFKYFLLSNFMYCLLGACAWQQNPTPSTLDNSINNQNALNIILHTASNSLGSKQLSMEVNNKNLYIAVYALLIKNKPSAISIISTPTSNTYFVNLIKSQDVSQTLFAPNTIIIHSETIINEVNYNDIDNTEAKTYLNSLGYSTISRFLKRTTYFHKDTETLTLVDYILPNPKTNNFDN